MDRLFFNAIFAIFASAFVSCLRIEPNVTELTFTNNASFTFICDNDAPITWKYPVYKNVDESDKQIEYGSREDGNRTIYYANITVSNAIYMDTGYYSCVPNDTIPSTSVRDICNVEFENASQDTSGSIYVFVEDEENLFAIDDDPVGEIAVDTFGNVIIPCRPTSRDVNVTLKRNDDDSEISYDHFDPKIGFIKKKVYALEAGQVKCHAERNSTSYDAGLFHMHRTSTDGGAKPYISASGTYPVEGNNIILNCSIALPIGSTIFIDWKLPDEKVKEKAIEGTQGTAGNTHYKMLTIPNITKYDQGDYICQVWTGSCYSENHTYYLNVHKLDETFLSMSVMVDAYNYTVRAGKDPTIQWIVNITAHPAPTIKCYDPKHEVIFGGIASKNKYNIAYSNQLLKFGINRIDISDFGTYTIEASNSHHKKEVQLALIVEDAPQTKIPVEKQLYYLNQNYTIDCNVLSYPLPRITWYSRKCNNYPNCEGSTEVAIPTSAYQETLLASSHSLKSTLSFKANETMQLRCVAVNDLGTANSSAVVLVSDIAESEDGFSTSLSSNEITVGDTIELQCSVSKYFYPKGITWNYRVQKPNGGVTPRKIEDKFLKFNNTEFSYRVSIVAENIEKTAAGVYQCVATKNDLTNKTKSVFVEVKDVVPPRIISTNMNGSSAVKEVGNSVSLYCRVYGVPTPIVQWYKNDEPLRIRPNNTRISLRERNQTLLISFAAAEDDANYACVAHNKGGNESASARILIDIHEHGHIHFIIMAVFLFVFCIISITWALNKRQKERKLKKRLADDGLLNFEEGAIDSLNPEIGVEEQADLLPYDRRWEFPRDKLKFGKQLGSGAFGVVMKAEADGIIDPNTSTTVAVKMVKKGVDPLFIRALASELKIMIHLGHHLNVVNLLGACTRNINKRELVVIVEFCKYGNLRDFLLKQRNNFVNQIDEHTGEFDFNICDVNSRNSAYSESLYSNCVSAATEDTLIGSDGYLVNKDAEPDWRSNYRGDYRNTIVRPITSKDLLSWSYQIARGMEYLSSRKVLHGDLAARNVLLADDNIVKICDFGLAKSMYNNDNYKRKGHDLLPVKWMAVESLRERVFSIQSDVWSFGITLWEIFSLSVTPYPGVEHYETLYNKLENNYRLEKPAFATREIHSILLDCWHARPTLRPTFTELAERLGEFLESGLRSHYTNLNEVYMRMNANMNNEVDYLALLNPPVYSAGEEPRYVNIPSRESPVSEEDFELKPMLHTTESNYITTKPILYSNPNYMEFNKTNRQTYVNVA